MIAGTPKPIAPVGRLPFAFAKRHGVLVRGVADGKAQVVYREGAHEASFGWSASVPDPARVVGMQCELHGAAQRPEVHSKFVRHH